MIVVSGIEIPNGMPMYIVGKLINDFDTIFCQARGSSICFLGARNHLAIHLKITKKDFFSIEDVNWNTTYAFKSDVVKRNIAWFMTKANSSKNETLNIIPHESEIHVFNNIVEGKLRSFVENPPIPRIPKMDDGVSVKIVDLKEMVNQIKPFKEEVLRLTLSNSEFKMSGSTHDSPIYNVRVSQNTHPEEIKTSTLCLKEMLLISCRIASEVSSQSSELRFYPGGATQISSNNGNVSVRCLLTAVKDS